MEHRFESQGNIELLSRPWVTVFASRQAPQNLAGPAEELADGLERAGIAVAGGWQSPLEKRFFKKYTIGGRGAVVWARAAALDEQTAERIPAAYRMDNAYLILAPDHCPSRPTPGSINRRDAILLRYTAFVLFLYIKPGGRLEALAARLMEKKFPLFIADHAINRPWVEQGLLPLSADDPGAQLIH